MKHLKRVTAIMLALMLATSMAGCAKKQTPAQMYDAAAQKNSGMDSMDLTTNTTAKITQQGVTTDQTTKADMKISGMTSDKLEYLMTATTTVGAQSVEMSSFYQDGYYYIDTMGQKIKFAFDIEEMTKKINESTGLTQFTSADMKELTAKASGKDNILTYTVDPSKMDTYMNQVWESLGIDKSVVSDFKITEMSGEMTINKDGYYTAMKTNMKMDMTVQNIVFNMDSSSDMTINNPGIAVEFEIPATDGYQEVDASAMGFN